MSDGRKEEAEEEETLVSSIPQERTFLQEHTTKFPESPILNPFLTGQGSDRKGKSLGTHWLVREN